MNEAAAPPYPPLVLRPAAWSGVRRALARCLTLAHAGALPASLLLVGEPRQGREALAVELAAALTCRTSPRQPCSCSSCERVRRGVHPDVHLLQPRSAAERRGATSGDDDSARDPQRMIAIDEVRELIATLDRHPFEGLRRVVILDPVHTPPLGVEAAVALLKALEEPPPKVVFLALAANPRHVLSTIVSRTVAVRVPPPIADEATEHLAAALAVTPEDARTRLAAAGGDLTAALTLAHTNTNQLVSLAAAAASGDGAALGALAKRLKREGTAVPIATAIVETLRAGTTADAERLLEVAAALLTAQRTAAALNIGLETVAVGRLAALR